MDHPFPLIRGGGLFLLVIGVAMVLGAAAPRRLWTFFIAGTVAATAALALTAVQLAAPLGRPTPFQISSLVVAVVLEVIALAVVGNRLRSAPERRRVMAILLVVGAHFVVMAPAFGPLVVLLAALSMGNALAGLREPGPPWRTFWVIDGALKAAIGATMLLLSPRTTW